MNERVLVWFTSEPTYSRPLPSNNRGDFVLGDGAGVHRLQVGLGVGKLMTSQ